MKLNKHFFIQVCITSLTAGGNQVLVDKKPNFWIDGDALPTEEYNCGNSEVWANSISFQNGQSRGICNTNLKEWIDLPVDYTHSQEIWGEIYYKLYDEMTAEEARMQCEADGASLPVPRSSIENDFYAALYPNSQVWLGLTTIHNGTNVITYNPDSSIAMFTNWGSNYIYAEDTSGSGAFAYIDTRNIKEGIYDDMNHWNNNKSNSDMANAVCVYKIPS